MNDYNEYITRMEKEGTPVSVRDHLKDGEIKIMKQADFAACPHCIMVMEHYLPSGQCRCTDSGHIEMGEWGYKWDGLKWV